MSSVTLANFFRVETDKPDLLQAQVKALSKQIPLLLFITVVNTLAVAATHYGTAPYFLTVGFPLVVTIGYAWHGLDWAKLAFRPPHLPTPLPGASNSESIGGWTGLICSSLARSN